MPTPTYSIRCLRNLRIANDIWECAFSKPEGFTFKPGQFVLFKVPLVDNTADLQPRAYSIASAPEDDELLFVLKLLPGGRASRWVSEMLTEGMVIDMQGPFGIFGVPAAATERLVFGCTSTGVAPFRSIVRHAMTAGDTRRMDLVFGVRNADDLFWADDLTQLAQQHEPFNLHIALSQPHDSWTGHRGRIQTVLPAVVPDIASARVLLCGNPAMIDELKTLCLGQWGIPKERLHAEGYI